MTREEVLKVIPVYHAIYNGAPATLIARIDEDFADGNFRHWAKVTDHARRFAEKSGRTTLDAEIAENVLARIGNTGLVPAYND